jgi:hypothetical protein
MACPNGLSPSAQKWPIGSGSDRRTVTDTPLGCHSACNIDPLSRGIGVQKLVFVLTTVQKPSISSERKPCVSNGVACFARVGQRASLTREQYTRRWAIKALM